LDEIGDMPVPLQAKILRFLQERSFERVGSTQTQSVDVRVVSATHQDLDTMIAEKTFRDDLFFRISEINLEMPPLRDRGNDVLLIAQHLLTHNQGSRSLRYSQDAVKALEQWSWPGNVRELENKVRRAAILVDGDLISALDLELSAAPPGGVQKLKDIRAQAEIGAIQNALLAAAGNMSEAARTLGVSRPTLYNLIEKHHVGLTDTEDA
jgi:two-component system NtrC family response regulator